MTNNTYHKHTLTNGLTLLAIPMPSVKSVTGLLLVGAGSRYEDKRINGLSHFLEHMPAKGTKKRPTALAIAEEIDSVGGENNAFTGKEYTGYYIKAAQTHLEMIVDVLSDMVLNPLLREKDIEKERGVILEEINMYEDMPPWKIGKNFERLLYGDTPLGRQTIGTKENIRKTRREDFVKFLAAWYRPENAVFAVAGGVEEAQVKELVEEKFGEWSCDMGRIGRIGRIKDKQGKPEAAVEKKKTEQSHIVLGVRAYKREHPRRYALGVLATILGGGMSSRLFQEVREKRGLAYYVRAAAQRYRDVGYLAASAGVDKERIEEAIRVILGEFGKMREIRVKEKELKKAKEYLRGNLILNLEDSQEVAELYGSSWILERKVRTPEEILGKIDKVTAAEVQEVAREIFIEEKLNMAVIGPFEDKDRFKNLLQL